MHRSKTDQTGAKAAALYLGALTTTALGRWIDTAAITTRAVFRQVRRGGNGGPQQRRGCAGLDFGGVDHGSSFGALSVRRRAVDRAVVGAVGHRPPKAGLSRWRHGR